MQVKIFSISAKDSEINDFLDAHQVIENGIVVREDHIVILYLKPVSEEDEKVKKLQNTLKFFRDQYVGESVNHAYYLKLEMAGKGSMTLQKEIQTPMGPQLTQSTVSQELTKAKASVESLKVQIVALEEMIVEPPSAPTIADKPRAFGHGIHVSPAARERASKNKKESEEE